MRWSREEPNCQQMSPRRHLCSTLHNKISSSESKKHGCVGGTLDCVAAGGGRVETRSCDDALSEVRFERYTPGLLAWAVVLNSEKGMEEVQFKIVHKAGQEEFKVMTFPDGQWRGFVDSEDKESSPALTQQIFDMIGKLHGETHPCFRLGCDKRSSNPVVDVSVNRDMITLLGHCGSVDCLRAVEAFMFVGPPQPLVIKQYAASGLVSRTEIAD